VHHPVVEVIHLSISVIGFKSFIINKWIIIASDIEAEAIRSTVVVIQSVGKDLSSAAK
jgi:hypothetical protein